MKSVIFKNVSILVSMLCLMVFFSGCSDTEKGDKPASRRDSRVELAGAGASFPAPLMTAMADEYRRYTQGRVTINYQSIGSGGGMRQFGEQTIMFGMSEAFLSDKVMQDLERKTGGKAFNIPITLADVVATYNLPGIDAGLVFDGDLLVDIFMGRITRWNDSRIQELNPEKDLPNLPVQVVHRSDGSGTTNVWTSYLSNVSDEWRENIGYATSVNWPTGIGGNGNEGVAGVVMNTPGAIGYNSYSYALLNDMSYGAIQNRSGNIIHPSFSATSKAADIDLPKDTRILFTDTPAPYGYPAAGFAWMLAYENMEQNNAINTRKEAEELVRFILWAITEGQDLSEDLGYARLPEAAVDRGMNMIRQMKWDAENIGEFLVEEIH
ncbi:phosphate ABC transporter substrate-binding protein PstS [Chitinivibrio alkaliphilus]|uniref:Phosphate-binding protein n=1 Tax=Chitinivibrio alkaliphilus ACht1 TaxID=1313304 RepID=U7D4Z5_9BACT|nr:phosphate ABC transporter substrate-binding protein PstS [Chitinivibrio alkaliphilus]ERP31013.1 phosphate ABC transporter substrate-binding protein [Chitinivibrio alkaliphilus ACht1]